MKKIISDCSTGVVSIVNLTTEEIAEVEALKAAHVPIAAPAPTKEQLMSELAALTAKIEALA